MTLMTSDFCASCISCQIRRAPMREEFARPGTPCLILQQNCSIHRYTSRIRGAIWCLMILSDAVQMTSWIWDGQSMKSATGELAVEKNRKSRFGALISRGAQLSLRPHPGSWSESRAAAAAVCNDSKTFI